MDLNRLAGQILSVVVSDSAPDGEMPAGWLWIGLHWFSTSDGKWYRWNGSAWVEQYNPFANANFTGTISADGDEGITGSKTLGGYRITFKKGLLTGFDPV